MGMPVMSEGPPSEWLHSHWFVTPFPLRPRTLPSPQPPHQLHLLTLTQTENLHWYLKRVAPSHNANIVGSSARSDPHTTSAIAPTNKRLTTPRRSAFTCARLKRGRRLAYMMITTSSWKKTPLTSPLLPKSKVVAADMAGSVPARL